MPTKTIGPLAFHGGRCYACDAKATGYTERGGPGVSDLLPACPRHADHRIGTFDACIYCNGPVRAGSVDIDGEFAHVKCHKEACRD